MANFTKKTERNVEFAKGGNTPMFGKGDRTTTDGKDGAHGVQPGQTSSAPIGPEGPSTGDKFAKGGGGKMFGYSPSMPAKGGITSAR